MSAADGGTAPGNIASEAPSISGDGSLIAFASEADNLVPGAAGPQIYLRNVSSQRTRRVSAGALPDGDVIRNSYGGLPDLSEDGRFITYSAVIEAGEDDYGVGVLQAVGE